MPFESQRRLFRLPDEVHYLNCAYMAPLARSVEEAAVVGLERSRTPYVIRPEDFFEPSDRVKQRFAELMGLPADGVAIVPSVSYALAIAANHLHLAADQEIVVAAEQFPSNYYVWQRKARDAGARLRVVEAPEATAENLGNRADEWTERLCNAIGGRTALVALPHLHWSDGSRFDLEAIGQRCDDLEVPLILDLTQSAGAVRHDFSAIQPTLVVAAAYKTLFGPYGHAFASFGDRLLDAKPLEETWIARVGSDDFARLVDYQDCYRPGAVRFDVGERSSPLTMPMLDVALQMVSGWGPDAVQEYTRDLLSPVLPELERLGCLVAPQSQRAHHLLGIYPPAGTDLERLRQALASRNVFVSIRGRAIRVSLQVYNEPRDLAALLEALTASLVS